MNKTELRDSYIAKGWEVQPVANWLKVSEVEGKVKYDVNVVSPDNVFGTAQVVITGDNTPEEATEVLGLWKEKEEGATFQERLRTFLNGIEEVASIFAVKTKDVSEKDAVATCSVYKTDGTTQTYVVKERDGVITYNALV